MIRVSTRWSNRIGGSQRSFICTWDGESQERGIARGRGGLVVNTLEREPGAGSGIQLCPNAGTCENLKAEPLGIKYGGFGNVPLEEHDVPEERHRVVGF